MSDERPGPGRLRGASSSVWPAPTRRWRPPIQKYLPAMSWIGWSPERPVGSSWKSMLKDAQRNFADPVVLQQRKLCRPSRAAAKDHPGAARGARDPAAGECRFAAGDRRSAPGDRRPARAAPGDPAGGRGSAVTRRPPAGRELGQTGHTGVRRDGSPLDRGAGRPKNRKAPALLGGNDAGAALTSKPARTRGFPPLRHRAGSCHVGTLTGHNKEYRAGTGSDGEVLRTAGPSRRDARRRRDFADGRFDLMRCHYPNCRHDLARPQENAAKGLV